MSILHSTSRPRLAALASLGSALALIGLNLASVPAGAQSMMPATTSSSTGGGNCPVLELGNPNPGDRLPNGGYVVSGLAFDPSASQGAGVSRVDLFLGARDEGGMFLGSAVPGQNTIGNPREFQIQVTVPSSIRGADFVAYAYSAQSGAQTSVSVPVFVGSEPTPTTSSSSAMPETTTMVSNCSNTATVAAMTPGPSVSAPAPASATTGTSGSTTTTTGAVSSGPVLSLANPNPGDLLQSGGLVVSGTAYDPASAQGVGVDRVEFFLGARDAGGLSLGTAVPGSGMGGNPRAFTATIQIPNGVNGGHDFTVYAHSSVTGQETVVSVPVNVGVAPTPTPHT